jgi:Domain of unknown function (DUF4252)
MKSLLTISVASLRNALVVLAFGLAATVTAQTGRVELGQLDHLNAKASETVDVNVDEKLLQLTWKFLSKDDPDEAKIKEIVTGLKGVYVKSFEFEKDGEYSLADLESIRSQVRGNAWSKVVTVTSKKQGTVEVYIMTEAGKIGGLVVLVADPNELTVVNLIGPVDIDKLSQLEGHFDIPELDLGTLKSKPKN